MPTVSVRARPKKRESGRLSELLRREASIVAEREAMERLLAAIREASSHPDLSLAWAEAARSWRLELDVLDQERRHLAGRLSDPAARDQFKEVERGLTVTRERLRLTERLLFSIRSASEAMDAELTMNEAWHVRSRQLRTRLEWIRRQRERLAGEESG